MAVWNYTLKLKDVFGNDSMSFPQQRDTIVARIRQAPLPRDRELRAVVGQLAKARDLAEFNRHWPDFYDWADANRVWVETF